MAKKLIQERLPPVLDSEEEAASAAGAAEATIYPYTQLRMIRPDLAIAAVEDGKLVIYHCMDNSRYEFDHILTIFKILTCLFASFFPHRELFGNPINPMEFELDDGPAIEALLSAYPEPVTVSDLEHPSEDMEDKVGVAQSLYKEGFLMIVDEASQPVVENQSDDDSDNPF